jgi:hypothetical protein
VLRTIFKLNKEEVAGGWRRLHNKLDNLYTLPVVIRVLKSRTVRWEGNVVRKGEMRNGFEN